MEGHKEVHVTLSPHSPVRDPPEPAELIAALQVRRDTNQPIYMFSTRGALVWC